MARVAVCFVTMPILLKCRWILGAFAGIVGLATFLDVLDHTVGALANKPLLLESSGKAQRSF